MASSEVPSLIWVLMGALDDLTDYHFQRFKLYLMDRTLLGEFGVIRRSKLETEDKTKILKAMMDSYGIFAISVIKIILIELDCNHILQELSQYPYDPETMIAECQETLQSKLKSKFQFLVESLSTSAQNRPFHEAFTELYITQADSGQVNEEHEVKLMEEHSRKSVQEKTVQCQDIFRGLTETGDPIRAVLTKGVAGVGKTVLTQKFSLDWAEGRANQDIQLLFHFTFRDLNVLRDTEFSLVELLHNCFSETKDLFSFNKLLVLFIFDGLDECRLPLDFSRTRVLTEDTECVSIEVLLVNLIRGSLLPSARVWITTRPAAASLIPAECVSMVTEVRGFTELQMEQYFKKRFRDEQQATAVISHIKSNRSLYIMGQIPVFCWILSTVLSHVIWSGATQALPHTLTQMYIRFLVVQAKVKNHKYEGRDKTDAPWTSETREMVQSLAKLAFEQLKEGNLIFYERDLRKCGLDAATASVYSGVFTEVFKEELGLYQDRVYCFIHLSVQEFLAALHVHQTFFSCGENLLSKQHMPENPESAKTSRPKDSPPKARDTKSGNRKPKAEQTTGYLGLSSVMSAFMNIFKQTSPETTDSSESDHDDTSSHSDQHDNTPHSFDSTDPEIFYRSAVDRALQSPNGHLDMFLRFFLGLSLPTNQSLLQGLLIDSGSDRTNEGTVKYIKEKLNETGLSTERSLNLLHCLNELNDRSLIEGIQDWIREESLLRFNRRMSPAEWSAVVFVLLSSDSDLEEFDLRKYCSSERALLGLLPVVKASTKAILSGCGLSPQSCTPLTSMLSSSSLTLLDLSNNGLQDSGVELLCKGLKSAPCRLETLSLSGCGLSPHSCPPLASVLSSSSLTHLDLSNNDLQDSGTNMLCEGLKSTSCKLEKLRLSGCLISAMGGASLASALSSAHSHLSELDLSYNHPGSSIELLTSLWVNPHCPLDTLRLDPTGERWMVPGLRKYWCEFSLDPNTAHRRLCLSEDKRTVTCVKMGQQYPVHPDRFADYIQVLSSTGLRGRCYWEVHWSDWSGVGVEGVEIAVSYKGIKRKRGFAECEFGGNSQSWCLGIFDKRYSVKHNQRETQLSAAPYHSGRPRGTSAGPPMFSDRVAVFLDTEAGVLSFYQVRSDGKLSHIYTFGCCFTQPMFPGFGLGDTSRMILANMNT